MSTGRGTQSDPIVVLCVSHLAATRTRLRTILRDTNIAMVETASVEEAAGILEAHRIGVVLCERALPESSWIDLLDELRGMRRRPMVIVTTQVADPELVSAVLGLGGFDVLAEPYEAAEVRRAVVLAWIEWKNSERRRGLRRNGDKDTRHAQTVGGEAAPPLRV